MSRISIELIPRDTTQLLQDHDIVRQNFPAASLINIPDLTRMPLRSWEAATLLQRERSASVIPHIRAIDIAPNAPLPCTNDHMVSELLVIEGDPPVDAAQVTWPNTSVDIIRRYKQEAPQLKIYAAFDPYRRAPYQELDALKRKQDAGADGFFTQPVFDMRMLELCAGWLENLNVFWGVSPVVGNRSRAYWERMNNVVFPAAFDTSLDANIAFAQIVLGYVEEAGGNLYIMPLRVSLQDYLGGLRTLTPHLTSQN